MDRTIASLLVFAAFAVAPLASSAAPIRWQTNGHYYERIFNTGGITWTDAKFAAESATFLGTNGHLVAVNSEAEWLFILDKFPVSSTWIGLSDANQEGNFEWVTGEPLDFTAWLIAPQEPNNAAGGGGEDYVYYESRSAQPPGQAIGWNDYQNLVGVISGLQFGYLIEYPIPEPSTLALAVFGFVALVAFGWRRKG